jgi:hypothetical protein
MSEVMDVINAFGTPLKLAWVGWVGWGVGQYFWYRHERSMPVKRVTSVAKPAAAKKVASPATVAAQAAEAPVVGRLFTPTHVTAESKASVPVLAQVRPEPAPPAIPMPAPVPVSAGEPAPVPAFEPPKAVAAHDSSKAVGAFDPAKAVAAFDPAKAVIEQFGATNDEVLDKFVRDFEMQDARPRRRNTPHLPETPSYGAEAPQVP